MKWLLLLIILLLQALPVMAVEQGRAVSAVMAENEFPAPAGYQALPLKMLNEMSETVAGGKVLAWFVPAGEYAGYVAGEKEITSYYAVTESVFASDEGELAAKDFLTLKQLLESGFFMEQTAELLGNKYPAADTAQNKIEVEVESIYDLPEGVSGYMTVEPAMSGGVYSGKRITVVYEVLLSDKLLTVEYVQFQGEPQDASRKSRVYIESLAGSSVADVQRFSELLALEQGQVESGKYPGFSEFGFTAEYPGDWSKPRFSPDRRQLLEIEPCIATPPFAVNVVFSSLLLPADAAGAAAAEIRELALLQSALLRNSSSKYNLEERKINGVTALVEELELPDTDNPVPLTLRRRGIYLLNGRKIVNIVLNLYYPPQISGEKLNAEIAVLDSMQLAIAESIKFE